MGTKYTIPEPRKNSKNNGKYSQLAMDKSRYNSSQGWYSEPERHSLSAQGISTGQKTHETRDRILQGLKTAGKKTIDFSKSAFTNIRDFMSDDEAEEHELLSNGQLNLSDTYDKDEEGDDKVHEYNDGFVSMEETEWERIQRHIGDIYEKIDNYSIFENTYGNQVDDYLDDIKSLPKKEREEKLLALQLNYKDMVHIIDEIKSDVLNARFRNRLTVDQQVEEYEKLNSAKAILLTNTNQISKSLDKMRSGQKFKNKKIQNPEVEQNEF